MNYTKNQGFSLIELMIVIAIIGILAAIAIPSYQTYVDKSRFAEIFSAGKAAQDAVAEYATLNGGVSNVAYNTTNGCTSIQFSYPTTGNVASVTINQYCQITIEGGANFSNPPSVHLYPQTSYPDDGSIQWYCQTLPYRYPSAPASCPSPSDG
jgi:type IV pilus assembly protein PilA